jgi:dihydroorotate dehydrogenase
VNDVEIERIAELLLLKCEDFKDKERLRDLLKDYIKTKDEISYLESILEDFEQLDINLRHLKRDAEAIKSLLPRLSKYTNIPVFMKIVQMLDTVEKIDINELESVRWGINKEIEGLNDKLKKIENEMMAIITNEALAKIGTSNLEEFFKYLEAK